MKNVSEWRLYVITDRRLSCGRSNEESVRQAVLGGADVIQFRDKQASTIGLYREAILLRQLTADLKTAFIINDRVDVALAVNADGIHLGQDDLPASVARKMLGPHRIIGVSASSLAQAADAARQDIDYLGVGPVFATSTKDAGPAVGLELLRRIKERFDIPLIAIGGIDLRNVEDVLEAGADAVAVISAVVGADDMAAGARSLKDRIERFRPTASSRTES